jgi:hypothetical protein
MYHDQRPSGFDLVMLLALVVALAGGVTLAVLQLLGG